MVVDTWTKRFHFLWWLQWYKNKKRESPGSDVYVSVHMALTLDKEFNQLDTREERYVKTAFQMAMIDLKFH